MKLRIDGQRLRYIRLYCGKDDLGFRMPFPLENKVGQNKKVGEMKINEKIRKENKDPASMQN